ncbi:hypothetical protein FYJ91_17585 [Sphingomonas montanisoli]|uniref:Oxidoreductase-like domain-containing protein n=1 Tax=Sphingomonas montanisoli TaxID=2606412 RepID=A0A5D9C0S4_9SPHN|nr:hypothetical protein FYJ91_17585 [Sphingomonas montanisoli]
MGAATARSVTQPPAPPRRPDIENCCGRGCEPCIFDYYNAALERWEGKMRALGLEPPEIERAIPGRRR